MRKRAEHVDETRLRITEATVRLHTTVGPSATSIAAVAEEAGVTRLTVYRHFPTIDALFAACTMHWIAGHPLPDPTRWAGLPTLGERARAGFRDLFTWYRPNDAELYPIQRDVDAMPQWVRDQLATAFGSLATAIVGDAVAGPWVRALVGHLVGYWTWRSLVRDGGLADDAGTELAAKLLERAAEG